MLEVQQQENKDSAFEEEMERRFKEMEEGKGIILTVDEFMTRAKGRHEAKMKSAK